jgi:hypothetical protein
MDDVHPVRRLPTNTGSLKPEMYRPDYTGVHRGTNAINALGYPPTMWIDNGWVVHRAHPECNYTWCETAWSHMFIHVATTVPLDTLVTCIACEGNAWRFSSAAR